MTHEELEIWQDYADDERKSRVESGVFRMVRRVKEIREREEV